ncbi:hypothetical protein ROA7450_03043 [Roseovarius albus]|uniref:Uncharacterized protein n=1 Tax=Roseovarius albus TaxID=1247867 RepID=A0A1X6ZRR6_9RHOB|nr:hypothetical protein ROA7450_03043 [Roseovarius albus]
MGDPTWRLSVTYSTSELHVRHTANKFRHEKRWITERDKFAQSREIVLKCRVIALTLVAILWNGK